jgi:hypothetical protein
MPMTVRQMAARLNEIVAANDRKAARGDDIEKVNRNDFPMYVTVRRGGRKGDHYYPVKNVSSAWHGLTMMNGSEVNMLQVICDESEGLIPTSQGFKPRGEAPSDRVPVAATGPVKPTRFPELGYQHQGKDAWRILDRSTGAAVGPLYPTRESLLADLERFAGVFGCE